MVCQCNQTFKDFESVRINITCSSTDSFYLIQGMTDTIANSNSPCHIMSANWITFIVYGYD